MFKKEEIEKIVKNSIRDSLVKANLVPAKKTVPAPTSATMAAASEDKAKSSMLESVKKSLLKEASVLIPKTFTLKTEFLSAKAKIAHEALYKTYVNTFNKVSSMLDVANTEDASANSSALRTLKMDEQFNLNAAKLHELYFSNISDLGSQISVDAIPYIRLSRDFGSFDRWQFDFRACAMAAREGWVVTYYEPYKNVYMNCVVDGHTTGIPVGGIPIIVLDMWSHAYFRDYLEDKKSYVNAMMKELNWSVVEARMTVAEKAGVDVVFRIAPIVNSVPERILQNLTANNAPIEKDQIRPSEQTGTQPGPTMSPTMSPTVAGDQERTSP